MSDPDERLMELEVKLAYAEEHAQELDGVVAAHSKRLDEVEEELRLCREALRRVAANMSDAGEVLGAYDADDPVPRSG